MIRKRVFEIVEISAPGDRVSRTFDTFIIILILLNVIAVSIETVDSIHERHWVWLYFFDTFSVFVFTIEYVLRVWSSVEDLSGKYSHPILGRLKYMFSPMALIDLIAILPFYLFFFIPFDLRFMRIFRVLRILKLARYSGALDTLMVVFHNERRSLFAAFTIMMTLLVFLSSIMYFIEREAQEEAFASIPHAMWWGMATLTTVGYGDVVPVTVLGKLVGALVTLLGLGMFAMPAAILASGFTRESKRRDFTVTWNLVARVPLFAHLSATDIADIAELLRPRLAVPGEIVLHKGDRGDCMFFMTSGEVEIDLDSGPVHLVAGDYFGEIAILYQQPRTATVTARTSCQFLVLDGTDFADLLERHPGLGKEITEVAARRMQAHKPSQKD